MIDTEPLVVGSYPPLMKSPLDDAIDHIRSNWRRGSTLKSIAARFNVDPGNLDRQFRRRTGVTVKVFIDQRRKEHVLTQLRHDRKYGYEIGTELGFEDDLAFYRWVKRAFGVSLKQLGMIVSSRKKVRRRYDPLTKSK
jgi:AraC-like DNA-binding protein